MRRRARAVFLLAVLLLLYAMSPIAAWALLVTVFGCVMIRRHRSLRTSQRTVDWPSRSPAVSEEGAGSRPRVITVSEAVAASLREVSTCPGQ